MKLSREREERADTLAAVTCGTESFSEGLKKVIGLAGAFNSVFDEHITSLLKEGKVFTNYYSYYYSYFQEITPQLNELTQAALDTAMMEAHDSFSSHPSLSSRLSYVPRISERYDNKDPADHFTDGKVVDLSFGLQLNKDFPADFKRQIFLQPGYHQEFPLSFFQFTVKRKRIQKVYPATPYSKWLGAGFACAVVSLLSCIKSLKCGTHHEVWAPLDGSRFCSGTKTLSSPWKPFPWQGVFTTYTPGIFSRL